MTLQTINYFSVDRRSKESEKPRKENLRGKKVMVIFMSINCFQTILWESEVWWCPGQLLGYMPP